MRKPKSTKALDNQIKSHGYVATIYAMMRKLQEDVTTSYSIGLIDRAKELETLSNSLNQAENVYVQSICNRYRAKDNA